MGPDYIKFGKRVGRKGLDIDNETIKNLYLNQGLTLKQVAGQLGISQWTVLSRLKKIGVRKLTRHKVNHDAFGSFTAASCYWAGFIAADGTIQKNGKSVEIELQYADIGHLIKFCDFVGRDDKIWVRERESFGKLRKYATVSAISKQITSDLSCHFNIVPNKSSIIQPPISVPQEYVSHFVRGYIDGDGSIGWHKMQGKPRVSICSGSVDLLRWVETTIKSNLKTGNPLISKSKSSELYTIEFSGNQTYGILDWLYLDSSENIRLSRKFKKYNGFNSRRIN